MSKVTQELDLLLSWVSWIALAACVAGIFLIWVRWKKDLEISDSLQQVLIIVCCAALISNAVRIALWIT